MWAFGTFETCQTALKMSVYRGRPEETGAPQNDAIDPDGPVHRTQFLPAPSSNLTVLGRARIDVGAWLRGSERTGDGARLHLAQLYRVTLKTGKNTERRYIVIV